MRRLYLISWLGFLAIPFLLVGCAKKPNYWADAQPGQRRILVSFPPLYAITHAVAGDRAYVLCLLSNEGVHDYQGAHSDVLKVNNADLFIYNGLTLDDAFADKMLRNRRNKELAVLNVGAKLDDKDDGIADKQKKLLIRGEPVKHGDHWHGAEDPHYWLGPPQAIAMTEIIAAKLAEFDPAGKTAYQTRAAEQIKKLEELQEYGNAAFKDKKNKKIITMHGAFDYFAKAFGIEVKGTIQSHPGADADAVTLPRLVKLCKAEGITVIAKEPQFADAPAQALQRSLKRDGIEIQIINLDPLETAPIADKKSNPDPDFYFKKMRENIDTLAKALP